MSDSEQRSSNPSGDLDSLIPQLEGLHLEEANGPPGQSIDGGAFARHVSVAIVILMRQPAAPIEQIRCLRGLTRCRSSQIRGSDWQRWAKPWMRTEIPSPLPCEEFVTVHDILHVRPTLDGYYSAVHEFFRVIKVGNLFQQLGCLFGLLNCEVLMQREGERLDAAFYLYIGTFEIALGRLCQSDDPKVLPFFHVTMDFLMRSEGSPSMNYLQKHSYLISELLNSVHGSYNTHITFGTCRPLETFLSTTPDADLYAEELIPEDRMHHREPWNSIG